MSEGTNEVDLALSRADQFAKQKYDGLCRYVEALINRERSRPGSLDPKKENRALTSLLESALIVFDIYWTRSCNEILELKQPLDRYRYYTLVLNKLEEHVLLLSSLCRPNATGSVSDDTHVCLASLSENRVLLGKCLRIIAERIGLADSNVGFSILTVASENFQHAYFRYAPSISVVGAPPSALMSPVAEIGVLWHEIAGYAVARARYGDDCDKVEKWAKELRDTLESAGNWEAYWNAFRESYINDVLAEVELVSDDPECPHRMECHDDIFTVSAELELRTEWQTRWLAEFFEDLYGVQALGKTMVEMLARAMAGTYDDLTIGDEAHPPPNLRLAVALEYLRQTKPSEAVEASARLRVDYGHDGVDGLNVLAVVDIDSSLGKAAASVVALYLSKLQTEDDSANDDYFCRAQLSKQELRLADLFKLAYAAMGQVDDDDRRGVTRQLWQDLDAYLSKNFDPSLIPANYPTCCKAVTQAVTKWIDERLENKPAGNGRDPSCRRLDAMLQVQFVYVDQYITPDSGIESLLRPRPIIVRDTPK